MIYNLNTNSTIEQDKIIITGDNLNMSLYNISYYTLIVLVLLVYIFSIDKNVIPLIKRTSKYNMKLKQLIKSKFSWN
ncbi:MAG: hypothetical protein HeimC3_36320 [Candidatus Heimdallarchaeota archaeon LC_3]|nr:MAG: hypothetical protein HeimC3_36320 [Candidatus Heimdallarchaeota archaeon LC_3]